MVGVLLKNLAIQRLGLRKLPGLMVPLGGL
jgi:hypothetical protein